jgi:hypothetical protein
LAGAALADARAGAAEFADARAEAAFAAAALAGAAFGEACAGCDSGAAGGSARAADESIPMPIIHSAPAARLRTVMP